MQSKRHPRCPTCHTRLHWDAMVQNEAQQDLDAMLISLERDTRRALVLYLALFRPATRDLDSDRAHRIASDVLALHNDQRLLTAALIETVDALKPKQSQPGWQPLGSSGSRAGYHNYLKRVLESVTAKGLPAVIVQPGMQLAATTGPQSKTAQTIAMLQAHPGLDDVPEWFTRTLCGSFVELLTMGLDSVPAADTMPLVVERWHRELWPKRRWAKQCRFRGAKRLRTAIIKSAEHSKRWPQTGDVLGMVPEV